MARIVRMPNTPEGRELLRLSVKLAGGWDMPDGSAVDDDDFDADEIAHEADAAYERAMRRNKGV